MASQNPLLNGYLALGATSTSKRAFMSLLKAEITERNDQHDQTTENFAAQTAARTQAVATLNQRIDTVVGLAPESLDTLKELADAINNDPTYFSTIEAQMNENDLDITHLNQALGINENATNLGGFNDSHLQDNTTLKQVLEAFAAAFTGYKTSNDTAVAAVQADVDQNEADCDAGISAEAAARAAADTAETTARQAAITALQADVDQNESDADASVAALQAADTAEASARATADASLQTAIDAVQADVNTNEADADASIAALTAADAAEALARAAADTTLQTNIDAEASARATAITNLVNGADAALDTLKEIGDALAAGDTSVTAALTTQITTEATNRTAAIAAAQSALQTAINTVQSDVDANEADADAAIAARLPLAGGTLTGSLAIQKSYPDIELKAGDEKRILFSDAGGGSTAAIKHVSSTLDLFAGGIAGGNKELSVASGSVDVVNQLKIGGAAVTASVTELNKLDGVTASTAELNHSVGVTSSIQTQIDGRAALTGAQFTGNLTLRKSDGSAVALVLSRADHADMSCVWKIQPSYVSSTKEVLSVLANGQVVVHFDERQRLAVNMTDPDYTLDVGGDGHFSTNLVVDGTLSVADIDIGSGKVTYNTGTNILVSTAGFATAGTVTTGSISSTAAASIDAASLSLPNIPEFADDAAAATGGLAVGKVYRTGSVVKIRVS